MKLCFTTGPTIYKKRHHVLLYLSLLAVIIISPSFTHLFAEIAPMRRYYNKSYCLGYVTAASLNITAHYVTTLKSIIFHFNHDWGHLSGRPFDISICCAYGALSSFYNSAHQKYSSAPHAAKLDMLLSPTYALPQLPCADISATGVCWLMTARKHATTRRPRLRCYRDHDATASLYL